MNLENSSIKDSWNSLSKESIKVVLDQAEKNLEATIETAKILTDRAINVLQFSIPVAIGLMGVISTQESNIPILVASVAGLFITLIITIKGLQIYQLYKIQSLGNKPTNLLTKYNLAYEEEFQDSAIQFSIIQSLEGSIKANEDSNLIRVVKMYAIMQLVRYGFASVIFLYLVLRLWSVWSVE